MPLFNAGRTQAINDVAEAGQKEAVLRYEDGIVRALEDVENALVALRDERQRAEETIRDLNTALEKRVADRTAELADTNHELSKALEENEVFVFSVSHDLRSPLVNLDGFSKELALVTQELRATLEDESVPAQIKRRGLDLLDHEELGLRLLTGDPGALDRRVAGAHAIEIERPTTWLEQDWIMLTTGSIIFSGSATAYPRNAAFRFKMVALALALLFHFTLHRRAVRADAPGVAAKLAGVTSLVLGAAVVAAGRMIAFL